MGQGRMVEIGVLLITYKGSNEEQPIYWVLRTDLLSLQQFIAAGVSQEAKAAQIRAQIQSFRSRGVTDAQMKAAGLDVEEFERMATATRTWSILSYKIEPFPGGGRMLRVKRTHELQAQNIQSVRMVRIQQIED